MRRTVPAISAILLSALAFLGCKGKQGPEGPAGAPTTVFVVVTPTATAAVTQLTFQAQFSGDLSTNSYLGIPTGLCLDTVGNVVVADYNNSRLEWFTDTGAFFHKWGSAGFGVGQVQNVDCVVADSQGYFYLTDTGNHRIYKTTVSGYVAVWGHNGGDGNPGTGDGEFNNPMGLAFDGTNLYVVDTGNSRIQVLTKAGVYVTQWGSYGAGNGQFSAAVAIACDPAGYVYVADANNNRIQKFTTGGTFVADWGPTGLLNTPQGVAVDGDGNVWVSDTYNHRIKKFDPSGNLLGKWGKGNGSGIQGSLPGEFYNPEGLWVDNLNRRLYVADSYNNRVQVFGF